MGEQLTLNQRVQGSKSLCAHHKIKDLEEADTVHSDKIGPSFRQIGSFCSFGAAFRGDRNCLRVPWRTRYRTAKRRRLMPLSVSQKWRSSSRAFGGWGFDAKSFVEPVA